MKPKCPKDIMGRPLPTGNTKPEKRKRIKNYIIESVIFAAACAVMDVILIVFGKTDVTDCEIAQMLFPSLNKPLTVILSAVITFSVMFLISFIFEYLITEKISIKRYNKSVETN